MSSKSNKFAKKVLSDVDVMLGYWGRDLRCRFANDAYKTWFGKSPQEIIGISIRELLGPLYRLNLPHISATLNGQIQVFEREIPSPTGGTRHSLASYYPDIANGRVRGFTVQVTDVTRLKRIEVELKEAKERAEWLATHDFLTALPNRALLMDRLTNAMVRARNHSGMVAIVAIDMDGFKAVNDSYGHEMGDSVLSEIAARMKRATRSTDTVMRVGGDEFVLVIDDLRTIETVGIVLERFLHDICRPIQLPTFELTPSFSCGISLFPLHGNGAKDLLATADTALYQAKEKGKGCFVFAGLPSPGGSEVSA